MEAVLFASGGPVAHMINDFIEETGKLLKSETLPVRTWLERKRPEARENLVESLEAGRGMALTRIDHVGTFRSSDRIPIGMHLQQVGALVVAPAFVALLEARRLILQAK